MDKLHVLVVVPDGGDFALLKQAGTLALALSASGMKMSLLVSGGPVPSPMAGLHPDIKLFQCPPEAPWWRRKPALWHGLKRCLAHDDTIDIVHVMDVAYPASALGQLASKVNIPLMGHVRRAADLTGDGLTWWQRPRHLRHLALFKPLVVSSHHLLDVARKQNLSDVVYIPEGVNTDQFKPVLSKRPIRRTLGLPEKATLVCCMASICPENNQLETVEKCLPLGEELQLLFIGDVLDKAYLAQIQRLAQQHNVLPYIHFIDAVGNPEEYLKASDLFILLGGIEQRHATILEAQSAGLPVVLYPSPSSLFLTNGNKCGVVLYPDSPLAHQAFEKLLTDGGYRQGRAVNTRPHVKKEFSFSRMVAAYARLYQSL